MTYIIGIDYTLPTDETAFAIIERDSNTVFRLGKGKTLHWDELMRLIRRLNSEWQPKTIWVEGQESSAFAQSIIGAAPLSFVSVTTRAKQEMIARLKQALEQGDLKFPDDVKPLAGNDMALAIAWHGVANSILKLDFD